ERELSSYLNVYRVSLDTAKRSIVKKHGGNPATLAMGVSKTLRELMPGEQSVNLLARIVSVNEKDVTVEGGSKRILYGILGDPTSAARSRSTGHRRPCSRASSRTRPARRSSAHGKTSPWKPRRSSASRGPM